MAMFVPIFESYCTTLLYF